jgi:hypothetical protein
MTSSSSINLPPGFEQMSREEQVEYVRRLWEYVSPTDEELPVPDWQLELVEERLERFRNSDVRGSTTEEVQQRMLERFGKERDA